MTTEEHPELLVFNRRDEPVSASITMNGVDDGSTVLSETVQLDGDGEQEWQLDLSNSRHRISTEIENGPEETFAWTPGSEGCCLEVHVDDDSIEYRKRSY